MINYSSELLLTKEFRSQGIKLFHTMMLCWIKVKILLLLTPKLPKLICVHSRTDLWKELAGFLKKKCRKTLIELWNKVLWTDEIKINLYLTEKKREAWWKMGSDHEPKHSTSSSHSGTVVFGCFTTSLTHTLTHSLTVCINDMIAEFRRVPKTSEVLQY